MEDLLKQVPNSTEKANRELHIVPESFFQKHKLTFGYDAAKARPYENTNDPWDI